MSREIESRDNESRDNEQSRDFLNPEIASEVKTVGMSTRESVMLCGVIVSMNFLLVICGNYLISVGFLIAYVLFWFLCLRPFQRRSSAPINFLINFWAAASSLLIPVLRDEKLLFFSMIPLVFSCCFAADECEDGKISFNPLSLSSLGYVFIGALISVLSRIVVGLLRVESVTLQCTISVIILFAVKYIFENLFHSQYLCSEGMFRTRFFTPAPTRQTLEKFVSERLMFVGYSLSVLALLLVFDTFLDLSSEYSSFIGYVIIVTVGMLFMVCFANHRVWYEPVLALIVYSRSHSMTVFLLLIIVDIMITGFCLTASRKEIFMKKNKYAEGTVRLLMLITVFAAISECCII